MLVQGLKAKAGAEVLHYGEVATAH